MICKGCKKEHERPRSEWCSESCYFKHYYQRNKQKINNRRKIWYENNYVPHPLPRKTEEEKKATRKKYYDEHREYYKQKSREYHLKHKNDEEYRKRKNENLKSYLKRRRNK